MCTYTCIRLRSYLCESIINSNFKIKYHNNMSSELPIFYIINNFKFIFKLINKFII